MSALLAFLAGLGLGWVLATWRANRYLAKARKELARAQIAIDEWVGSTGSSS